jgi:hypothetical protein
MANDPNALTNMWMMNPSMFDPTQQSNQFSQYNNAPMPWPPTYNTGPAGGPVNAATGQPIQSFQDWQKANPGGTTINSTPAAPQQQPDMTAMRNAALTGQPGAALAYGANFAPQGSPPGIQQMYGQNFAAFTPKQNWQAPAAAPQQAQPQASAPPNNWMAAINALANPGKVQTQGATVPMQSGSQPAGGVNQAWLQGIGSGAGMNQNFIGALRGIQGR